LFTSFFFKDSLLSEYDEVNRAAERLLIDYMASLTTTMKSRLSPLGRDEKKIYPFSVTALNKIDENNNNEYDYDKTGDDDDDYEDDDDDDDESTIKPTKINNNKNNDQVIVGDSDWDVDTDATFNLKIDSNNVEQTYNDIRPLMPINDIINHRRISRYLFMIYLPYIIGILFILCLIFGVLIFRFIYQQRRKAQYGNKYEKKYVFTEIDSSTPEEKALHALQMNGYENPTYKFFEGQTPKC
jgi:hypothetical protein